MDLTADEKDMLALTARNPDVAAWREHYRLLKLPGHDTTNNVVTGRIRKLRQRPDAKLYLDQQRAELERNRVDAMKEADGAGWKVEQARRELAEETYRLAITAMVNERKKIEDGVVKGASTPSSIAKLVEVGERMSTRPGDAGGMTAEQRSAEAKQLGITVGESVVVPVSATPSKPPKAEGKA